MDLLSIVRNLCEAVTKSPTKVAFVAIKGYVSSANETSNVLLNVGVSYENAQQKDLVYLQGLHVSSLVLDEFILADLNKAAKQICTPEVILNFLEVARLELIQSILKPSTNRSEAQINAYTHVSDGLKMHNDTKQVYVWGMQVQKTVITKGTYKEVNSRPLTVAKDLIRELLKHTKYRQYILNSIDVIKVNGTTIEIDI